MTKRPYTKIDYVKNGSEIKVVKVLSKAKLRSIRAALEDFLLEIEKCDPAYRANWEPHRVAVETVLKEMEAKGD